MIPLLIILHCTRGITFWSTLYVPLSLSFLIEERQLTFFSKLQRADNIVLSKL